MGDCPVSVDETCDPNQQTRGQEAGAAPDSGLWPPEKPVWPTYFAVSPSNNSSGCSQYNLSLLSSPGHEEKPLGRPCQSLYPRSKAPAGSAFL